MTEEQLRQFIEEWEVEREEQGVQGPISDDQMERLVERLWRLLERVELL